jgi:hypothetical protein
MGITLFYINNVRRGDVGALDYADLQKAKNPTEMILGVFRANDMFILDREPRLLIVQEGTLSEFDMQLIPSDKDCTVICSQVIAVNNTAEYARADGIIFFFHTAENGHLHNPHIHAQYGEDEISIYLKDYRIVGNFRNKKKQKKAVDYVKENASDIKNKWDRIMKCSKEN